MPETTPPDRVSVRVPFSGLYNTVHDTMVDLTLEQINASDTGDEIERISIDNVEWSRVHLAYVQRWLQEARKESGLDMAFQKIITSRDYALGNDQIIATVPLADLEAAFEALDDKGRENWRRAVEDALTPRPGFAPHSCYPTDADDWGPVAEWDDAQRDLFFEFHAAPLIGDEAVHAERAADILDEEIWKAVIDPDKVPGHVDNTTESTPGT